MCGHGTIGVVETLRWLGKLQPGVHVLETCVGEVQVLLHEDRRVTLDNVPSYRIAKDLSVTLSSGETLLADIAYGGNHFALVDISHTDSMSRGPNFLIQLSTEILQLVRHSYPDVDHVELFDRPSSPKMEFSLLRTVPRWAIRSITLRYWNERQTGLLGC